MTAYRTLKPHIKRFRRMHPWKWRLMLLRIRWLEFITMQSMEPYEP